jgi:hypothetical protein
MERSMKNMSGKKHEFNSEMLNIPWNINALSKYSRNKRSGFVMMTGLLFKHTVHQVSTIFALLSSFANRAIKSNSAGEAKFFSEILFKLFLLF